MRKYSRKEQDQIVDELAKVNAEIQWLESRKSRSEYEEQSLQIMKNRREYLMSL